MCREECDFFMKIELLTSTIPFNTNIDIFPCLLIECN